MSKLKIEPRRTKDALSFASRLRQENKSAGVLEGCRRIFPRSAQPCSPPQASAILAPENLGGRLIVLAGSAQFSKNSSHRFGNRKALELEYVLRLAQKAICAAL